MQKHSKFHAAFTTVRSLLIPSLIPRLALALNPGLPRSFFFHSLGSRLGLPRMREEKKK